MIELSGVWPFLAALGAAGLAAPLLTRHLSRSASWWVAVAVAMTVGSWAVLTVEALALPAFAVIAATWGAGTAVDLAEHRLPDFVTLAPFPVFVLLLMIPAAVSPAWGELWSALLGATVTAAILFVLAYINPNGFGLGDVKLGLTTGAALGWLGLGTALLGVAVAFILMAVISGVLLATTRIKRDADIAFGPFMVLGVLVAPFAAGLLGW